MNKIYHLKSIPKPYRSKNSFSIIISGKENKTLSSFLSTIFQKLNFPENEYINYDAYLDWIRDLSWIKEKQIVIIIENFSEFLSENIEEKTCFISDLENVIFTFWENNAEKVFENEENLKEIIVYCFG